MLVSLIDNVGWLCYGKFWRKSAVQNRNFVQEMYVLSIPCALSRFHFFSLPVLMFSRFDLLKVK